MKKNLPMTQHPTVTANKMNLEMEIREFQIKMNQLLGMPVRVSLFTPPTPINKVIREREKIAIGNNGKVHINFDVILNAACVFYNVDKAMVLSKTRQRAAVRVRNVTAFLLYAYHDIYSHSDISYMFNRVNHTSSIHWVDEFELLLQTDREHALFIIDSIHKFIGL